MVAVAAMAASAVITASPALAATAMVQQPAQSMPFDSVVRTQQMIAGVPVFGGQLVTVRDKQGQAIATHGRTTLRAEGQFPATDAGAAATAIADVAKRTGQPAAQLTADAPQAYWYDATLGGAQVRRLIPTTRHASAVPTPCATRSR